MTLQETIERKLYETWCEVHGAEPNWGRSTPQSPSGFKTSRSLWAALAYTAIACVREHATSEEVEAKGDERTRAMLHSEILDYQSGRVAWIKGVPRDGRKSVDWLRGWDAAHADYDAEYAEAKRKGEQWRDVALYLAASLAAAISLLEHGGKKAAPSNKMFDQMLDDYRGALARFRAAVADYDAEDAEAKGKEEQ